MNNMLVEFKTTRCNSKESFEIERLIEVGGATSVDFERKHDYITCIAVEMDDVIDFTGGQAYINGEVHDCVYARLMDETSTPNLLIKYEDFKSIVEHIKNTKIKSAEEILNQCKNENHPTGI